MNCEHSARHRLSIQALPSACHLHKSALRQILCQDLLLRSATEISRRADRQPLSLLDHICPHGVSKRGLHVQDRGAQPDSRGGTGPRGPSYRKAGAGLATLRFPRTHCSPAREGASASMRGHRHLLCAQHSPVPWPSAPPSPSPGSSGTWSVRRNRPSRHFPGHIALPPAGAQRGPQL